MSMKKAPPRLECPAAAEHTPMPDGYADRREWMERMMLTHEQKQCVRCGLWAIWVQKTTVEVLP